MSTIEDFENAPVGATATNADGLRAMKMDDSEWCWIIRPGVYLDDKEMVSRGYTLDPSPFAPTTAREALELVWELAHPVKEGQVWPDRAQGISKVNGELLTFTAHRAYPVVESDVRVARSLEPLPEPEPDWLDAPAVIATLPEGVDVDGLRVWVGCDNGLFWTTQETEFEAHWSELMDVTPLYPKEG